MTCAHGQRSLPVALAGDMCVRTRLWPEWLLLRLREGATVVIEDLAAAGRAGDGDIGGNKRVGGTGGEVAPLSGSAGGER